jgi:hypothetical protein
MGRVLGIVCRAISSHLIQKAGAVSEKRLSLTPTGNIRYLLKTPYNDGTTHVIVEPLDFIAPNSKHRVFISDDRYSS